MLSKTRNLMRNFKKNRAIHITYGQSSRSNIARDIKAVKNRFGRDQVKKNLADNAKRYKPAMKKALGAMKSGRKRAAALANKEYHGNKTQTGRSLLKHHT